MEIYPAVAQAFISGVTVAVLALTLTFFSAIFSLLIGAVSDWILGAT